MRTRNTTIVIALVAFAAAIWVGVTLWRGGGEANAYEPPSPVAEDSAASRKGDVVIERVVTLVQPQLAVALRDVDEPSHQQFADVLSDALQAYNSGTLEDFRKARSRQGFDLPESWASSSPASMLSAQAGALSLAPAPSTVTVHQRYDRGSKFHRPNRSSGVRIVWREPLASRAAGTTSSTPSRRRPMWSR